MVGARDKNEVDDHLGIAEAGRCLVLAYTGDKAGSECFVPCQNAVKYQPRDGGRLFLSAEDVKNIRENAI